MVFELTKSNNNNEWDELVATSPQGNIFSNCRYLEALNAPSSRYVISTPHGEVLAGVVVMENQGASDMHVAPFPYTPYQGILFSSKIAPLPQHKRITREFRITEFIIHTLIEIYGNFNMSLSPSFGDIRPFLWHNYHQPDSPHFLVRDRYTATLDLTNFHLEIYLKTVRTVRRQEYKKSRVEISETDNIPLFIDTYVKTFTRQGIEVSNAHLTLIKSICTSALTHGYGRLSMAMTDTGVASMSLFIHDKRCAYYLFGANDPSQRKSGASTKLMIENINEMAKRGIGKLDFVGVNSPNRGDFKLSFNPELTPYHEVTLESG